MGYMTKFRFQKPAFYGMLIGCICLQLSCDNKKSPQETPKPEDPLYTLLTPAETGVIFSNTMSENDEVVNTYEYRFNGAGLGTGDINNDGLPDIFFAATNYDCKLFLNKGNLKFEDISEKAGIQKSKGIATGVSMVDINSDGFLDIYVCKTGKFPIEERRNQLYINNGNLTFTESAKEYGLDDASYSNQAVFFDIDNDTDLDMYLVNQPIDYTYANTVMNMPDTTMTFNCGKLFRNEGNGKFTDISKSAGVYRKGFGFNANVVDVNRDGAWDLYVTNDYLQPDYLYINNGNGKFTESLSRYMKHCSNSSMGSCFTDFNNDGLEDLFVLDMIGETNVRQKMLRGPMGFDDFNVAVRFGGYYQYMRNMLQLNNGNGTFSEIGQLSGVSNTDWSWGPIVADLDNDGWKDLFVANGYRRDLTDLDYVNYFLDSINKIGGIGIYKSMSDMFRALPETPLPNYAFRNNGDLTFANTSTAWGFKENTFSNGSVATDLDNDGDLEIIINNIDQPAMIYRSNAEKRKTNNFLQFRLKGNQPNTLGSGVKIELTAGGQKQIQTYFPVEGYMSSVENRLHFGLGESSKADTVVIVWPGGAREIMTNVVAGKLIVAEQKNAAFYKLPAPVLPAPLFEEITNRSGIDFVHKENDFIDFKREPLLPQRFSEPGPAFSTGDVNGDGKTDVFIGGALGQAGVIYIQNAAGTFKRLAQPEFEKDLEFEDAASLLFDSDGDGDNDLYVCSGGNEFEENSTFYQDRLYLNNGKGVFSKATSALPEMFTSTACVTASDFDGDGDQDLFVGGRIIPWKYPKSPRSYLLLNDKGNFTDVTDKWCPELITPGLVTTAIWTDFDNDKKVDLIVAGQWMPIKVFKNSGTSLIPLSPENAGLSKSDGWWNTIASADLDGDGDTDYLLGNRGNNSRFQAKPSEPATVTVNDFDDNGTLDAILCYYIQGKSYPIHGRDQLTDQIRPLKNKLLRYRDYANATLADIFPKAALDTALTLYAYTFSSSYMQNNGNGTFTLTPLPIQAQFSCVNAIVTGDYDGDGLTDILLTGNDYSPDVETGRYDASIGCFLKGNGKGKWESVPVTKTGFYADRYIKGMKAIDNAIGKELIIVRNNDKPSVLLYRPPARSNEVVVP